MSPEGKVGIPLFLFPFSASCATCGALEGTSLALGAIAGVGLKEESDVQDRGDEEWPKSMLTYSEDTEIEVERGAEKLRGKLVPPLTWHEDCWYEALD